MINSMDILSGELTDKQTKGIEKELKKRSILCMEFDIQSS